ncbi:MAG: hypothetical protein GX102_14345 [Porphyromonadaceae bacterium]|nr:hypothetical protein [Porphyromonadaceae bacterium]
MDIGKQELNKHLNADVDFKNLKLNFIRGFPDATLQVKDLYVAGIDDFKGDTLLKSDFIHLVINLKSLFSDTGYEVKKVEFSDTKLFAHVLKDGRVNWDIFKKDTTQIEKDTTKSNFKLNLQDVKINRTDITYLSDSGNVAAVLKNLNLALKGDFTADSTLFTTKLKVDTLDFWNGGVKFVNKVMLDVAADINAHLKQKKYSLANNTMKINAIPLTLNGWVQLEDSATVMDLTLDSKDVDFKSILSLIPAIYSKSFASLNAGGKVDLSGFVKGKIEGDSYPAFDLKLAVADGIFQYPKLPKSVQSIQFASHLTNPGGSLDKTVVDVSNLSFNMGGNPFSASGKIVTPVSDPDFDIKALGKINLGMIKDVYPLEKGTNLSGLLDVDITAKGKMSYVEKNAYESFRFGGGIKAKDVIIKSDGISQDVVVSNADMQFNDRYLNLTDLMMKIGKNDLTAAGKVENYLAYALHKKTLKGDFKVNSNYLNVNDFMPAKEKEKNDSSQMSVIKIPKNIDLTLTGNFKEFIYDKMNFNNADALLKVANGNLTIQKLNVNAFGGLMALTGHYFSENPDKPKVDFEIDLKEISFAEIFSQVKTLQKIAPIFDQAAGKFNSKLSLNTDLQQNMMPVLASILSNGSLKTSSVAFKDVNALTELAKSLKLDNLAKMALRDIALMFEIKNGRVNTEPFNIKLGDYAMNLSGSTGLDQTIDYAGKFRLPDKINAGKFQNIGFNIGGTFKKPTVKLDIMITVTSIVEEKKSEAIAKADSIKTAVMDKGREARDKALLEAQKRADAILEQAELQGERLINAAKAQGDSIVAKTSNPIARELAKKGAEELVKQAEIQAENLNKQARTEADNLLKQAESQSDF